MIRCFCDGLWWLTLTVRRNEKNGERVERLPLNHCRMTSNFGKKKHCRTQEGFRNQTSPSKIQ